METEKNRPKCPRCGTTLNPIYPLNLKTLWVDFYICPKCGIAYNPKTMKPIAHVI
jgi:ribosomal protein S27AE